MATPTPATLLLLHGPGQSPPAWQSVVDHLDPERPMFAPWLKGLKPTARSQFDLGEAAADLLNTLELRGVERADLVGHSLGGMVALRAAAEAPERIGHLVLVSTPVLPPADEVRRQRRWLALLPASQFGDLPKTQVLAALDALAEADVSCDLSRIETPTLAVVAAGDQAAQAAAVLLHRQIGAQIRALPGADPALMTTYPAELAALIEDFCADRQPAAPAADASAPDPEVDDSEADGSYR
ncbi:MAG: alpha/beta hydrolase [Propionibacteriaceae bacterium]|jgi:pimeloyl-ACP methyl ester carboxylesterase|nr:alpha/beta hydrolase [Propionibacteriaceae bacterium]